MRVDPENHVVNLLVTDTAKAERILDQAGSEQRDGDFSTVRVSESLYTHKKYWDVHILSISRDQFTKLRSNTRVRER
ncbi:hypothetical protein ACPA54_02705 [Uniformispora flossi]|uniref:hypothetical protein n=1 Tax=Uniformispora flossi TaxID=3390723 RepID=UPI003C2F0FBC